MQFAVSRFSGSLKAAMDDWCSSAFSRGTSVKAIIDGSMFASEQLKAFFNQSNSPPISILASTPMESYDIHGPLLWEIDSNAPSVLGRLLRLCDGKPALSLISTRVDIHLLRDVLRWLAVIETEDGLRLYCRYADTRVLPGLLDQLNREQRQVLAIAIESWGWIERDGAGLRATRLPPNQLSEARHALSSILKFDDAQYVALLGFAEADMVCQLLVERMPDLLPNGLCGGFHARMEKILALAHARGISELSELFQYAVVALTTYDDFAQHSCLEAPWVEFKTQGGSFSDWLEGWPDGVWQALEQATTQSGNSYRRKT